MTRQEFVNKTFERRGFLFDGLCTEINSEAHNSELFIF